MSSSDYVIEGAAQEAWNVMNPYLRNLNRIEFIVTMACTGSCKHCSEGGHAAKGEHIDADIAAKAIYEICEDYHIDSLMTFGGEPLLYPEVVCKIHEAGKKRKIPKRQLITNGYFCKDIEKINDVSHMLAVSGVTAVLLSVDAFHQESIPLTYVMEFAKAMIREGVSIQTHPAGLVSAEDDNPYNLKTREILKKFSLLGINPSDGNIIFPEGNARKYLSDYFDGETEGVNPYKENPRDVRAISFSPNGDVLNGNVNRECMKDILNSYLVNEC